jgi:hypothetical protein
MIVEERLAGLNLAGSASMGDLSHGERGVVNEVALAGRPEYDRRPWASSMARSR